MSEHVPAAAVAARQPRVAVVAAYIAVADGLGQQFADSSLMAALQQDPEVALRLLPVGSVRSTLPVRRRLPFRLVERAPFGAQRLIGAVAYPRTLVHRFDARLPPARREVVTVHDLAPLRFPDEGGLPPEVGRGLRRARAVVCPSRFSADELRDEYGLSDVRVVPNGIDPATFEARPLPAEERERLGLPPRYLLHTGGATRRKNLAALAAAWSLVSGRHPDVGLVLCGPADDRRTELFGRQPRTFLLGKVPRTQLLGLMAGAAAVVVPSVYEGYGLPAAEAMACGVPVVAAHRGSLPEVVGEHGLLVEPDAEGLAAGLTAVLGGDLHPDLAAARAAAAARTWAASAASYAQIYRDVLAAG